MKEIAIKKILIINPFGIGDVLFTTPVIRAIKENFPEAFIGYWCNERVAPLLKNHPLIDKVFALSRGDIKKIYQQSKINAWKESIRLFQQIRREHFDISFDVSLDYRYNLVSFLAGIRKRIGLNYKNRSRLLTHKIDIVGFDNKHVVEYYLDALKSLNIKVTNSPKIELYLSKQDNEWAVDFLRTNNISADDLLIGIAPGGGASWGADAAYLRWPEDKFALLVKALILKPNARVMLFGSGEEESICRTIADAAGGKVINTAGKLTLSQFAALLSKCKILICNDAGPLHMAVGLGLKIVCLCGPVDEKVYGPFPVDPGKHRLVKKDLDCQPCYKRFRMKECTNRACLLDIDQAEVLTAVEELI